MYGRNSNNDPIGQTTASATNLCAGTYTGTMTDALGCIATVSVTIAEPDALNTTIASPTPTSCFNACDGSATVSVTGGTTPYTYLWSDGGAQTTGTADNLCAGNYIVTVTDAQGCTTQDTTDIVEPDQIILGTSVIDAFCETNTGTANATVTSGGVSPFNFEWDDPQAQAADSAINLIPGIYNVTATDATGCTATATATVGNILPGTATISSTTDVSCFSGSDGTATVSMSGTGTAPYTYEWFNSGGISQGVTGVTGTGFATGSYFVQVTDVNGCVSNSDTILINQPTELTATTNTTQTSCSSSCDGQAQVFPVGGTAPYTYSWDDPLAQITANADLLCEGSYTATVTDNNGCTVTASADITTPNPIVLDSTVTNANCGQADGSGCVIASGGTAPYTYEWPDATTNSCQVNLLAASYLVTVMDDNGCTEQISIQVSDLNGPQAEIIDTTMVSCNGVCDGGATVNMVGGVGNNFTVVWDANAGNQTTPTASNLCAGIYTVTITDDVGCNASTSIEITEPDTLVTNAVAVDPVCFAGNDGTATANTIGGTPGYTYEWLDANNTPLGQTGISATGLASGNYTAVVTDQNGCVIISNYTLTDPIQVSASGAITDVTCNGACDGTATATPITGVAPFTYDWGPNSGNQTTQTAMSLCPGTYICTVTDANGCSNTVTVTISEPDALVVSIPTTQNVSCFGLNDGFAQADATGGMGNYSYSWSPVGGITSIATNLTAGTYQVIVTDDNGCQDSISTTITQPQEMTISSTSSDVDCYGNCTGSATVTVAGGTPGYTFNWDDPNFTTTSTVNNLCTGTYTCLVTDNNGCQISENVTIGSPTPMQINVVTANSNCGQNNGQICLQVSGGTTPYTYNWNDPNTQTSACAFDLFANCYQASNYRWKRMYC